MVNYLVRFFFRFDCLLNNQPCAGLAQGRGRVISSHRFGFEASTHFEDAVPQQQIEAVFYFPTAVLQYWLPGRIVVDVKAGVSGISVEQDDGEGFHLFSPLAGGGLSLDSEARIWYIVGFMR